jgi:hypothetical protein
VRPLSGVVLSAPAVSGGMLRLKSASLRLLVIPLFVPAHGVDLVKRSFHMIVFSPFCTSLYFAVIRLDMRPGVPASSSDGGIVLTVGREV